MTSLTSSELTMEISTSKGFSTISDSEISFIINNIGPDLPRLGRKLRLSVTEMTQLDQGRESLKDKACQMINWWKQQNGRNATKISMIDALEDIERQDIAHELSNATHATDFLTDFDKFQRRLIQLYSHLSVPQPPGIQKDISIDKIFIDQEMGVIKKINDSLEESTEDDDDLDESSESKILQLQNLIEQLKGNTVLRLLIEGDPGFGKTTLTIKLATDWAKGRDYICSLFNLVLLIPLRELEQQQLPDVIVDIINRANRKTSIKREHLDEYLSHNRVLLLLDGYDEMCVEDRVLIDPILKKEELDKTCILITSRRGIFTIKETTVHSTAALLLKDPKVEYDMWDLRVILKGLLPEQRRKILTKHFEISSQTLQEMDELFNTNADQLFRCPLLVFWLGWMLEKQGVEGIQKLQTRTSFYKQLVNLIFHKTLTREKIINDREKIDIFSITTDGLAYSLKQAICEFGKIAIERMISNVILFTESDLAFLKNSVLLKSDLFLSYKTMTRNEEETYYQPMHKSFMEFLAAYSVCNSITGQVNFSQFKLAITKLVRQGLTPSLDSLFFPFVAGLMEEKADWLFQSLSPWASFIHISKPEMMNMCLELKNIDDELMQPLLSFIPGYYRILSFKGLSKSYFSSPFHKHLLQKAAERQLISTMNWNISIKPFPIASIYLQRIRLLPQKINTMSLLTNFISTADGISIHCKELIYNIDKNANLSTLEEYQSISHGISADQHNLYLEKCNSSLCDRIFQLTLNQWSQIKFYRISISKCNLNVQHMNVIIRLIQDKRITKGVSIDLSKQHKLTVDCVIRLWEAVIQTSLITEFSFFNNNPDFLPLFQFKFPSTRKTFQLLNFNGYYAIEYADSYGTIEFIQELSLMEILGQEFDDTNILANFNGVNFLQCHDRLLGCCLSKKLPFLSVVTELNLFLVGEFNLNSSWMHLMPSLKTLILDCILLTGKFPDFLQQLIKIALQSKNLRVLGFHNLSTPVVFASLVECFTKVSEIELDYLQLIIKKDWELKLASHAICVLRNLLRNKQIKKLGLLYPTTSSVCRLLPCWFSEEEFMFKFLLIGSDDKDLFWNKQVYEHFMECRTVYVIESKS